MFNKEALLKAVIILAPAIIGVWFLVLHPWLKAKGYL